MNNDEDDLIAALLRGEEAAFRQIVADHHGPMLGVASAIVGAAIAEEVVQEAWISAMRGLGGFEGRSALRTWLMRIAANQAKTRLRREKPTLSLSIPESCDPLLAWRYDEVGHWGDNQGPQVCSETPEALLSSEQLRTCLDYSISVLPPLQAAALTLREREGHSFFDICNILEVSESNARVLLHRARSRLFLVIEHFQQTGECETEPDAQAVIGSRGSG